MRILFLIWLVLMGMVADGVLAAGVPREPEESNQEYLLDIVTNEYSRWWRENWDAGDNRFRFRLGSNNVTQWFVEEELKVSAGLIDRVRFRFYHARLLRYATEEIPWDVLEFEGRVHDRVYVSLYARPTFDKRESSLGLILQHRRAANQFAKLSIEWPAFLRNFSERRRETPDSLLNIFTNQPVRFGLDVRERIIPNVWVRAVGELIPSFEMGEEVNATGARIPKERAEAKALDGWVEYIVDPSRDVRRQWVFGIEGGYQRSRKSTDVECGCVAWEDLGSPSLRLTGEGGRMGDGGGSSSTQSGRGADDGRGGGPSGRGAGDPREGRSAGDPREGRGGQTLWTLPETHFEPEIYDRTDIDTVTAWRDTRGFVSPYAWVPLSERLVLSAMLRYEKREIAVSNDVERTHYTTNEYIVPRIGVSYAMGSRRQYILESGLVSEFRNRTEEEVRSGPYSRTTLREDDFDDHRLYVAFEYVFGESNVIRLNEGFELDSEDRGQFGIHDHGFFQLIVGF